MKTKKEKKERKKMIVPTYRKLLMFGCMKKIKFIPNFFLEISQKYCKLVWVLRACLAAPVKNYSINLWKALMLSSIKKIKFISRDITKILQTRLGVLGMPGQIHHKRFINLL